MMRIPILCQKATRRAQLLQILLGNAQLCVAHVKTVICRLSYCIITMEQTVCYHKCVLLSSPEHKCSENYCDSPSVGIVNHYCRPNLFKQSN